MYLQQNKRSAAGKLSGVIGIFCNLLLAMGKITVGMLAGAMSVTADGLNNLSDTLSSVVTFVGFKLAERPADKEHPFGHARYEYLAGFVVSAMILMIGFELVKSSVGKILNPGAVDVTPLLLIVLILSICVKLFLAIYYKKVGKDIQSGTLLAASADSRNDVIATSVVLLCALLERFTDLRIDGYAGLLVSLFVLYNGVILARDTISPLLGESVNDQLREEVEKSIRAHPMVLGCHDLMVHDYGPGRRYASIHVEMDRNVDAMECHDVIDRLERHCMRKFGIHMVIHYDPVATDNAKTRQILERITAFLKQRDSRLEIHDLRIYERQEETHLHFDMVVPPELQSQAPRIKADLEEALSAQDGKRYTTSIIFDI